MENKTARILNTLGNAVAIVYAVIALLVLLGSQTYDSYYYDSYDVVTGFIFASIIVFIGVVFCFILKAIAELLENSVNQTKNQRDIIDLLKNNEGYSQMNYDRGNNNNSNYNNTNHNNINRNHSNYNNSPNLKKDEINNYNGNELPKL